MFESFILAGGRSTRMGTDKAFLMLGGKTFLDRIRDSLKTAGTRRVSVVTAHGKDDGGGLSGISVIGDIYPGRGALGGIHSSLVSCSERYAAIVACDYPFVSAELFSLLHRTVETEAADVAVPVQPDGIVQPLCGLYDAEKCLLEIESMMEAPDLGRSVREMLERMNTREITYEEYSDLENSERLLLNVNSKEDLENARALLEDK